MMSLHRIYGVSLRNLYSLRRNLDRMTDLFYWPVLDLVLWGVASRYLTGSGGGDNGLVTSVILGLVFWGVFWRGQYEVPLSLLEDIWSQNLINMFSSPLKFSEWVLSALGISFVKAVIQFLFAAVVALLLYKIWFFSLGIYILPFFFMLIMSGWWLSFFVAGIILTYGKKLQNLAWSVGWGFAPLSCIYYPLSLLPNWIQPIAKCIPMTYVFEGMRKVIFENKLDPTDIFYAFLLNLVFLAVSILYLKHSFKKVLDRGMAKLY